MKMQHISVALLAGFSVLCTSCAVYPGDGYGTFSYSTNGYGSSVAWTSASYDANGFPIFGYSYGRPVYGYTAAGAAVFSIAALTALCYVPRWRPAPWYHGHWHYPHRIHRVTAPPIFERGHRPHIRPQGGINAPIHRHPSSVLGKPMGKPGCPSFNHPINRPPFGHHVGSNKPGDRPAFGHHVGSNKPGDRPAFGHHVGSNKPGDRPAFGHHVGNNKPGDRPAFGSHAGNNKPGNKPAFGSHVGNNMPGDRPAFGHHAGNNMPGNRPSFGSHAGNNMPGNRPSFGSHAGGGHHGHGQKP